MFDGAGITSGYGSMRWAPGGRSDRSHHAAQYGWDLPWSGVAMLGAPGGGAGGQRSASGTLRAAVQRIATCSTRFRSRPVRSHWTSSHLSSEALRWLRRTTREPARGEGSRSVQSRGIPPLASQQSHTASTTSGRVRPIGADSTQSRRSRRV